MAWFRSHDGAPMDPKFLVVGKRAGVLPGIVSAVFWALLDHASQSTERGSVEDFDVESYALFSGFEEEVICKVLQALNDKRLIKDGRLSAWERRQPKDHSNIDRQREFRERKKEEKQSSKKASSTPAPLRNALRNDLSLEQIRTDLEEKKEEGSVLSSLHSESTGAEAPPPLPEAGGKPVPPPPAEPPPPAPQAPPAETIPTKRPKPDPWIEVYTTGKSVLGNHAGAAITAMRKLYDDKPHKVLAKILDAKEQREPLRWIYAFLNHVDHRGKLSGVFIGGVPP